MFDFLKLKKSVQGLGEQARSLAAEIEQFKQERERLQDAPLTRADYKKVWFAAIDREGEKFVEQFGHAINPDRARFTTTPASPLLSSFGAYHQTNAINPACLYFVLNDTLKKAVGTALDQVEWPSDDVCGPAPAEREQALATLDGKIETLEMQQRELIEAANAAGVDLAQTGLMPTGKKARR